MIGKRSNEHFSRRFTILEHFEEVETRMKTRFYIVADSHIDEK